MIVVGPIGAAQAFQSRSAPDLNSVVRSRIDARAIRGGFLHRRLGSNSRLVNWLLGLIGFGNLRHDADDSEGVGHLIALQNVVAVRIRREYDVLVADSRGDLHLCGLVGLH